MVSHRAGLEGSFRFQLACGQRARVPSQRLCQCVLGLTWTSPRLAGEVPSSSRELPLDLPFLPLEKLLLVDSVTFYTLFFKLTKVVLALCRKQIYQENLCSVMFPQSGPLFPLWHVTRESSHTHRCALLSVTRSLLLSLPWGSESSLAPRGVGTLILETSQPVPGGWFWQPLVVPSWSSLL